MQTILEFEEEKKTPRLQGTNSDGVRGTLEMEILSLQNVVVVVIY